MMTKKFPLVLGKHLDRQNIVSRKIGANYFKSRKDFVQQIFAGAEHEKNI